MRRAALDPAELGRGVVVVLVATAIACAGLLAPVATARQQHGQPTSTTLQWVGDIALSAQRGLPPGGIERALSPLRGVLRAADITTGNLEGTLSVGGSSKCGGIGSGKCFAFQAPPPAALGLRRLGFDLVNQANNHSLDYGASGRAQTLAALRRAGISATGLPGEITIVRLAARRERRRRRSSRRQAPRPPVRRVAFVGFAPYPYDADLLDIPAARALVRRARSMAPLVIVFIHAGAEGANATHTPYGSEFFLGEDRGDPRGFAHAMINAGACAVLGSGPHVLRGIERYRGRLIAYSLGNFVGYHTLAGGGTLSDSGILRITLNGRGGLLAARLTPVRLLDGLPRFDPSRTSVRLIRSLSRADFPTSHWLIDPRGVFRLRTAI